MTTVCLGGGQYKSSSLQLRRVRLLTRGSCIAHSPQKERPVGSQAESVQHDDEQSAMPGKASTVVELSLQKTSFVLYERWDLPAAKTSKLRSEKRKLSSSVISVFEKIEKRDLQLRRQGKLLQRAQTLTGSIEAGEEKIPLMSEDVKM